MSEDAVFEAVRSLAAAGETLYAEPVTLAQWLSRWVTGTLCQPALVQDPFTRQWRGAIDEEYAQWAAELDEAG